MCADACEAEGLTLDSLSGPTQERLEAFLPAEASLANPVDMIATASPRDYRETLHAVAADECVDAIVTIYTPVMDTAPGEVARAIATAAAELPRPVPVLAVHISQDGGAAILRAAGVPTYDFPEEAVRALARAVRYEEWRSQPHDPAPVPAGTHPERAAAVIASALAGGEPRWLRPDEVADLLESYGVRMPEYRLAASATAAGQAARELDGEVALKAVSQEVVHKTEAGAVRLNLHGPSQVQRAAREMRSAIEAQGHEVDGFLVQRMVSGGVEMLVGLVADPVFGPVLACAAGGTTAELMKDVTVRPTPLTAADPDEMVRSLASFPLLTGYRGAPAVDVDALEDLILRIGALAENHPEVLELECNPVMVTPEGAVAVDARARVAEAPPRRPWPALPPR
jgi:acyl-CoA synthetase (NDP forming)